MCGRPEAPARLTHAQNDPWTAAGATDSILRPLLGGYVEWKRRGYPLQDAAQMIDPPAAGSA